MLSTLIVVIILNKQPKNKGLHFTVTKGLKHQCPKLSNTKCKHMIDDDEDDNKLNPKIWKTKEKYPKTTEMQKLK